MPGMNKKIILLALSALAMRNLFYQLYSQLFTMDSQTCVETAKALFGDGLNYYTGKRTLVYPLVIALFGYDTQALVLFQMFLGILESLLVYAIFYKLSRNEWMGFAAGMLYALNPSQIFLERAILAETVLTLFIAFTFLCFFKALEKTEKHLWGIIKQIAC